MKYFIVIFILIHTSYTLIDSNIKDIISGYLSNDYYILYKNDTIIHKYCSYGLHFDEYHLFCNIPDLIAPNKTNKYFHPLLNCSQIHSNYYIFDCPEKIYFSMYYLKCLVTNWTEECTNEGLRLR